jgi:O-antigen/teichoic acid export membrane protein
MKRNLAFSTFGFRMLSAIAGFGTVVLCSRYMGAAGRGELSLALVVVQFIMIANEFVGGSTLVNLIPRYSNGRLLPFSYLWLAEVLILAAFILIFFNFFGNSSFGPYQIILMAAPLGLLTIHYAALQGNGLMGQRNYAQTIFELGKLLGVGICIVVMGGSLLPVSSVLTVFAISALIAMVYTIPFLLARMRREPLKWWPPSELFQYGWWSQLGHLVQFLNYRATLFMIDHYMGQGATGLYSNALVIADAVWIFGNSMGSVAHMKMVLQNKQKHAIALMRRYLALSFWVTGVAVVVLALLPTALFAFVFGPDFYAFRFVMLAVLPMILVLGWSTLPSHLLHARNDFKALMLINAAGCALQLLLANWWLPLYGLTGAGMAAFAGFSLILLLAGFRLVQFHGASWHDLRPSFRYFITVLRKVWSQWR